MKLTSTLSGLLALVSMVSLGFASPTIPFNATASRVVLVGDEIVQNDKINAINRLMFKTPLHDFLKARNAQDPPYVDWFSNGCNSSPDHPLGIDFVKACYRHDFGYQNFRAINRWNKEIRKDVDVNFQKDLFKICSEQVDVLGAPICYGLAEIYFLAVRAFGGDANSRSAKVEIVEDNGAFILKIGGVEKHRVDRDGLNRGGKLLIQGFQDIIDEDETIGFS